MPFTTNPAQCKKCGEVNKDTRLKWHKPNQKYYLQSTCKDCEKLTTKSHKENNPEKWKEYNKKSYLKTSEGVVSRRNNMNHTEESKRQWALDKATRRATRAKEARVEWDKELTDLVYMEAHKLRVLRNNCTGFEWHVDHVVPLKGKEVCGLHVWNNFAVIPKVENLRKGNKNSLYDQWKT